MKLKKVKRLHRRKRLLRFNTIKLLMLNTRIKVHFQQLLSSKHIEGYTQEMRDKLKVEAQNDVRKYKSLRKKIERI